MMTVNDWLLIGGYLLTILGSIILAVQKLEAAAIASRAAQESNAKLKDDVYEMKVKLTENSLEVSHLKHDAEKQDTRLTRLENHSFNL